MSSNSAEQGILEAPSLTDSLADKSMNPDSGAAQNGFAFDAMNLRVGDRLQVQPPARVSSERCPVRLIGYLQDMSLLITTPVTANSVRLQMMEGDSLVMRFFSGQNAFGFACDVQRACKLPYSYLHIAFPAKIQGTVIRKAARVKTKIIAKVRNDKDSTNEHTGVISNLSANGALLDARRTVAESGDAMKLTFKLKLHNIETELSLMAVVRAAFDDENLKQSGASLSHFGLQFVDLSPNDQMLLQSMVYQNMIEHPQSVI